VSEPITFVGTVAAEARIARLKARSGPAIDAVRRALEPFAVGPRGDVALSADRAAHLAVRALRDAGLLQLDPPACHGCQAREEEGLPPD